ncbi:hypothetical protein BV25DRAFT_1900133 [Artomyces pyxidatus]|uniref:Uncharacterized protein n=1 Tax=Artomyces pyxidatus TaxID=48021 RepID=A0ACB8T259_9AGAM|nr:hypothetical protein BV25DRAFT_1900133 [Artomyces pyxidatus]
MLVTPPAPGPRRPSLYINPSPVAPASESVYSDARSHGYQGPSRTVRLPRAASSGGGAISRSEDGVRCVVAGKESLRILRMSDSPSSLTPDHKSSVGRGGHRIDASRNLWNGSGLKVDSVSTDVAWGRANFDHKILTSARNGELIMWDLNKLGPSKYERRTRLHVRSIHKLAYSPLVPYYCMTGAADGDLRVWDLRDMSKSVIRIPHPISVRAAAFSPSPSNPVHAVVGLDNGSIYRWDLKMGRRGQLDRVPVAHSGPILTLDWCTGGNEGSPSYSTSFNDGSGPGSSSTSGAGWIVSGGLDRTVKVWDLTAPTSAAHMSHTPTYTLSTSFPVRRVLWRPGYDCELAVVSNAEFGIGSNSDMSSSTSDQPGEALGEPIGLETESVSSQPKRMSDMGDAVEIWDVRRGYIAKWLVGGSAVEGGVTDVAFGDSHALWAQHTSGTFSQLDLRQSYRPMDAIPRVAATWDASGSLTFVSDRKSRWEVPYDDIDPEKQNTIPVTKHRPKALGDGSFNPTSQSMGTIEYDYSRDTMDMFARLAKGYIFEGADKHTICGSNAEVALQANHSQASKTWLLLQSLFTPQSPSPSRPPTPPLSPLPLTSPVLTHSRSAPPSAPPSMPRAPALFSSTSSLLEPVRPSVSEQSVYSLPPRSSPGNSPARGSHTPSSPSNSPSPHRIPITPSTVASPVSATSTPSTASSRPSSIFPRRPSNASFLPTRPRAFSSFRRKSISSPSPAPSDGTSLSASSSLRHVGEGALDDSDSSSSGTSGESGSDDDHGETTSTAVSPTSLTFARGLATAPHPSPLSRVAGQQTWTEDEGEDDKDEDELGTPSPRSTDSDSGSSPARSARLVVSRGTSARSKSQSQTRSRSRKNSVIRAKTRSRSSTLAAPLPPPISKQGSRSSMRTVTAGDVSIGEHDQDRIISREEHPTTGVGYGSSPRGKRIASLGLSEDLFGSASMRGRELRTESSQDERRKAEVKVREERLRELGWGSLRAALGGYAEDGDMQMCALMSLVAQKELEVSEQRMVRFVEGYVDLLSRLRLHTSAAYLRKHTPSDEVRAATKLQTTVYVSCGRCEKPIIVQQGNTYCLACQKFAAKCSIWSVAWFVSQYIDLTVRD